MGEAESTIRLVVGAIALAAAVASAVPQPVHADEWYAGGNLHRATLGEWATATQRNRLATSGDFSAKMLEGRVDSLAQLKVHASNLETCISETARERSAASLQVAEIAAACAVLLGWR